MSNSKYASDGELEAASIAAAAFVIASQEGLLTPKMGKEDLPIKPSKTRSSKGKKTEETSDARKTLSEKKAKEEANRPDDDKGYFSESSLEKQRPFSILKKSTDDDKETWIAAKGSFNAVTEDNRKTEKTTDTTARKKKSISFADNKLPTERATSNITPIMKKTPSFSNNEQQEQIDKAPSIKKMPSNSENTEKSVKNVPSLKKTPTFTDKYLNDKNEGSKPAPESENKVQQAPKQPKTTTNSISRGTKDDEMDDSEMNQISRRYEKMNKKILEWVSDKKGKAKRRLERKERNLEHIRTRAMQEYRNEIARIDKIAVEAKELAEERKRNDESKARENTNKDNSTAKTHHICFCC